MSYEMKTPIWEKLLHIPYLIIYGLVKYLPSPLGFAFRWPILKLFGLKGGPGQIYEGVTILYPWRVKLGRGWSINESAYIVPGGIITIGNHVRIAARVSIISTNHNTVHKDRLIKEQGYDNDPIIIEDDVWIGVNSVILKGVTIGNGSVIGSMALVNKSIPSMSVAVGIPARVIRTRM